MAAPSVSSVAPTGGPTSGGTPVTITGTNFTGVTSVIFGGVPSGSVTVNSSIQIIALSPAHPAGAAQVVVTTIGGASTNAVFFFYGAPTVTAVSPACGPTTGGTAVTVTGTNFTGATAVTFGGTPAASFTVLNASTISATTPAQTIGSAQVVVTSPGGTSTNPVQFVYSAPTTLTTVNPAAGPITGGTAVTITGTNFTGATAVTFGGTPATSFTVLNATTITATTPAHAAGAAAVVVTTPVGNSNLVPFFYIDVSLIVSLDSVLGPEVGGNPVTINGINLSLTSAVSFGPNPAMSFTVITDNQVLATAPPGTGFVQVSVVSPGGTSNSVLYDYIAAPTVASLSPSLGPESGGNQVVLNGTHLGLASAVSFGGNAASFAALSGTQVVATAPAGVGVVSVTATSPGGTSTGIPYTYVAAP